MRPNENEKAERQLLEKIASLEAQARELRSLFAARFDLISVLVKYRKPWNAMMGTWGSWNAEDVRSFNFETGNFLVCWRNHDLGEDLEEYFPISYLWSTDEEILESERRRMEERKREALRASLQEQIRYRESEIAKILVMSKDITHLQGVIEDLKAQLKAV